MHNHILSSVQVRNLGLTSDDKLFSRIRVVFKSTMSLIGLVNSIFKYCKTFIREINRINRCVQGYLSFPIAKITVTLTTFREMFDHTLTFCADLVKSEIFFQMLVPVSWFPWNVLSKSQ